MAIPDDLAALQQVTTELATIVASLSAGSTLPVPETIGAVETAGRLIDAARVLAIAPLTRDRALAERLGFASPVAAVATLAQISERTARVRVQLAQAISPDLSVSGALLPPRLPEVSEALTTGRIGLDSATLITRELDGSAPRVSREARAVAEAMMVNLAGGFDPTGQRRLAPVSVDYLANDFRALGAAIDPDGARPREERAIQKRAVWVGQVNDDGLVPFGGMLDPVVGVALQSLLEAWRRTPRFASNSGLDLPEASDTRTPHQRRHDAFAEIIASAAAAGGAPQLNGRSVTVLVTVSAEQLESTEGLQSDPIGALAGSPIPLSRGRVEQLIDANGYRVVTLTPEGAVVGIGSPERCFTANQTLAIAARDGFRCSNPGCTSPHTALQVHHVVPWREGGPTNTSNGILLCYWHRRRVDDGPWKYRMVGGLPEVRGPGSPEWTRLGRERARPAWAA